MPTPDDPLGPAYRCACRACGDLLPAVWDATATLALLDAPLARRMLAEDGEPVREDRFLGRELALAAIMATAFARWADLVEPELRLALRSGRRTLIREALSAAAAVPVLAETELDAPVVALLHTGVLDGLAGGTGELRTRADPVDVPAVPGAGTALAGAPSLESVRQGVVAAAAYHTNRYFNDEIVPVVLQRIEGLLAGADPLAVPDLSDIETHLAQRLRSVPYWRLVANAAASRAYHYGYLKAAESRGRRGYRLVARIDARTSRVCQHLNGREFWVADALRLVERVAAGGAEAAKQLTPWRELDEIEGLDGDGLKDAGVLVPPFHGHCRTTMVML